MNIFATDHPIDSELPSPAALSDKLLDYAWNVAALTVALFPLFLGLFWFLNVTEHPATTGYAIDPFWLVSLAALIDGFLVAIVGVALYGLARKLCSR